MPTSTYEDDKEKRVYEKIEELLKGVKGMDNLILIGDCNAVVGEWKEGNFVEEHGLGKRNERVDRLVEFCAKHKLLISNTLFKNHERRTYTWTMPDDMERHHIDYISVRQRFQSQVKNCKSFPGTDIDSDHIPVNIKCSLKFKTTAKLTRTDKRNTGNT